MNLRNVLPSEIHKHKIKRVIVDEYSYDGSYEWKIAYDSVVLLLPETKLMNDFFKTKTTVENTLLNNRVYIEIVRQPLDRIMSLTERMTKWKVVARMLMLYAKVKPKINLSIIDLGGHETKNGCLSVLYYQGDSSTLL